MDDEAVGGSGLEGLNTGAEADMRDDLGGGVGDEWDARRLGVGGAFVPDMSVSHRLRPEAETTGESTRWDRRFRRSYE